MLILDAANSTIALRVYTEGALAHLAHNLELACTRISGKLDFDKREAEVEVQLGGIEVRGVVRDDRVVTDVLSDAERADCVAKMRRRVFQADVDGVVRVLASERGGASVMARLFLPNSRV